MTNFNEMPTIRNSNQYLNDYPMTLIEAAQLRGRLDVLVAQVTPLKEEAETKSGAAKGAITRKITPLQDQIDELKAQLKNAPPAPVDEEAAVARIIDTLVGEFHSAASSLAKIQLSMAAGMWGYLGDDGDQRGADFNNMAYQMRWNGMDLFKATEATRWWLEVADREHLVNFTTLAQLHTYLTGIKRRAFEAATRWSTSRSSGQMTNLEDDAKHGFYMEMVSGRFGFGGLVGAINRIEYYWDGVVTYRQMNPDKVTQLVNDGTREVEPLF